MRRLPGPAGRRLSEGVKLQRLSPNCFGTGSEHKLNLLCGLLGVLDSKWMSGSARAGTISREANTAYGNVLIRSRSAPSGARPEMLCFSLDRDWVENRIPQPRAS